MKTGLKHPLAIERIVAEVPLNIRSAILVEQRENGKVVVWICSRTPDGRAVPTTAARAYSIPLTALDAVTEAFARIDANTRSSKPLRLA